MGHIETQINSLLHNYFPTGSWRIKEQQRRGMNNTTRFVEANGERYVLRIYETHADEEKVNYEHAILKALDELHLVFQTPVPIETSNGNTSVLTEGGKIASLFRYLDGVNPALQNNWSLHSFGEAVAQLTIVLSQVKLLLNPVYRPYYEIDNIHPRCAVQEVIQFCMTPPAAFAEYGRELKAIGEQIIAFNEQAPLLKKLPHQLVHGDLNESNVLADSEGRITAILDFEFVTWDLRVMELAVCLSDLINPDQEESIMWQRLKAFLDGYASCLSLTNEEVEAVPLLVQLRRLDVFIHFLGRYWDGVDGMHVLEAQIESVITKTQWLAANEQALLSLLKQKS
jgi:homoserine kinase type II